MRQQAAVSMLPFPCCALCLEFFVITVQVQRQPSGDRPPLHQILRWGPPHRLQWTPAGVTVSLLLPCCYLSVTLCKPFVTLPHAPGWVTVFAVLVLHVRFTHGLGSVKSLPFAATCAFGKAHWAGARMWVQSAMLLYQDICSALLLSLLNQGSLWCEASKVCFEQSWAQAMLCNLELCPVCHRLAGDSDISDQLCVTGLWRNVAMQHC